MRADALAQYLIWKKWPRWILMKGTAPSDADDVGAVERAAGRFGGKMKICPNELHPCCAERGYRMPVSGLRRKPGNTRHRQRPAIGSERRLEEIMKVN
jgi:hypothetical protein